MKTKQAILQDNAVRLFYNLNGNIKKVCERLGIKRTIFYRWLKLPEFKKRIDYQIDILNDNLLSVCVPIIYSGNRTTVKQYSRKGKVYKTVTTTGAWDYPNRVVYKAIITIFKVFAARGNRTAMFWCGMLPTEHDSGEVKQPECRVYRLPRELVRYRIAA